MVGVPNGGAKIRRKIGLCKSLVGVGGILNCQVADCQCCIGRSDVCRLLMSFVLLVSRLSSIATLAFRPLRACAHASVEMAKVGNTSYTNPDYQQFTGMFTRTNGRTKCRTKPFCQCFTPKARNVQASRKNFTASHKILTASRKCFTVGRNFLVSPLVRL